MRLIWWIVLIVIVLILIGIGGRARAYEGDYTHNQIMQCDFIRGEGWQLYEVKDTIRCAFIRVGDASQREYALYVADRESGFVPTAGESSGGYGGLFQHSTYYWPGRYADFPMMEKWFNLPNDILDARTNAFVTARMVGEGNWDPWIL